jgi:chromosome segregation ATPase
MATSWDTEMVERLERVERRLDNVEERLGIVDSRLDRLETKVDALGRELSDVKARMATKADFERFATKADLEQFATKADFERFATKADFERFATKAELKAEVSRLATKAEVEQLRDDIRALAEAQQAGFQQLSRQMVDFGKHWDMKWAVHDLAIRDHGKRIARLERRSAK